MVDVEARADAGGVTDLDLGDDDGEPTDARDEGKPVAARRGLQPVEEHSLQSRRSEAGGYLRAALAESLPDERRIVPKRGDADVLTDGLESCHGRSVGEPTVSFTRRGADGSASGPRT